MSQKKKRGLRLAKFHREGIDTLSEVSAFLGGLFFTGLVILVQQREKFDVTLLEINLTEQVTIPINQLHLIAIPLSISVILFVFSAIFFALACSQVDQNKFDILADEALNIFVSGELSFFVSLFVVLTLVDILVSVLAIILSVGITIWWAKILTKV